MKQIIFLAALNTLAKYAMCQSSAAFTNMTWSTATTGQIWPIHWSVGNGQPVTLTIGNSSWSVPIFTNRDASPGVYEWTVSLPTSAAAGQYLLGLTQTGGGTDYSPLFSIVLGAASSPVNATLVSASAPTVTVVWWDDNCGCHKTTWSSAAAPTTGTGGAGTQYTWYDNSCGCTKTALAPVPTTAAGCNGSSCNNYTVVPAPTRVAAAMPSTWTGEAGRLSSPAFALVALVAAAIAA